MSSARVQERVDGNVLRMLPIVAFASGGIYLLSGLLMRELWSPHVAAFLTSCYVATGVVGIGVGLLARAGRIGAARSQDVMLGLLLLGAGHLALNLLDLRGIEQPITAPIGLVAAGIMLLSWPRFLVAAGAYAGAGALVAIALLGPVQAAPLLILTAASAAASALLHHLRLRSTRRTEELLLDNEEKRLALERALDELRLSQQQAIQREKLSALGTLVAGVAHEINNPLTYMRGNMELTRLSLDDAASGRGLSAVEAAELASQQDAVLRGIDRIEHITKSLREVARSRTGPRGPEDVNAIAENVLTVAQPRLGPDVEVRRELAARRAALADPGEIGQVVLNLVLNAAESMGGRGTLTLRTRDAAGEVVIEVDDTGPGIPPDVRSKLFTPFFTTKTGGTGLGLSISHGIVEQHAGRIEVMDAPGGGARLRVTLPSARTARAPRPQVHAQGS